jgi:hypothetical protein
MLIIPALSRNKRTPPSAAHARTLLNELVVLPIWIGKIETVPRMSGV